MTPQRQQLQILLLGLWLCLSLGAVQAHRVQREASAAPEPAPAPAPAPGPEPLVDETLTIRKEKGGIYISDATTTAKPLGIVSVKSRAIAMDRGLCLERSRYHPHYPKCHNYCKRLEHWIGQCWRESCHCIS
ncbi:hypothetical protein KR093_007010 [Drosophila rubida]|uniref:Uncharacterized protein n=1 Tax=Drosophila rubida TaxID=30044 RepID=A0AAD4KCG7_9MUSC|nr:hypothetical protein KR093_007010 [Drosophila rubida]